MEKFAAGQVVLAIFPYSDLSSQKVRPALVLAKAEFGNLILCQITSKAYSSKKTVLLTEVDFVSGRLPVTSYVRPDKLFTAEPTVVYESVGRLSPQSLTKVLKVVKQLFN